MPQSSRREIWIHLLLDPGHEHLALTVVAYSGVVVLAVCYGAWLLLPLMTLPFGLAAERAVWTARHREVLIPWTPRSAFLAMAHAALVALGLALS